MGPWVTTILEAFRSTVTTKGVKDAANSMAPSQPIAMRNGRRADDPGRVKALKKSRSA
jgi:hypothetical protein